MISIAHFGKILRVRASLATSIMIATLLAACAGSAAPTAVSVPQPTHTPAPAATATLAPTPAPLASPTSTPGFFTVYGEGPIVPHGQPPAWDDRFTDPGAVVFHDGQFHMFRNGFKDWPAAVQIGYVTSSDGYTWTKQGSDPVLTTKDVPDAGIAALASSVIVEDDGTWVLYFYTVETKAYPSRGSIGRATASQPTGPWQVDRAPVLTPGAKGAWDDRHVLAPHVIKTKDGYALYYTGYNARGVQQIGLATSTDGLRWIKYDNPATTDLLFADSDPVLRPGASDSWDKGWVHQPRVMKTPDGWVMFYRGTLRGADTGIGLGYATSPDGFQWTKSDRNPVLAAKAVPRAAYFWFTNMLYHNSTYFLFWEVDINQQTDIWLATHQGSLGR